MNQRTLETSDAEQKALADVIKWVYYTPVIAVVFFIGLVLAYGFAFINNGWSKSPEAWGQLGDYIGGLLNPLVAGFALIAVVVSVRLQKAELAETRRELENSRLAMEEQAKTAEQQRQEQRFFDLLEVYQQTLKSVEIANSSGKAAFMKWQKLETGSIHDFVKNTDRWHQIHPSLNRVEHLLKPSWSNFSPNFDHYFRVVFRILYEMEELLGDQQFRYATIFRDQLANEELILIGLNLWLNEGAERMRMGQAAEKYGLLKHLPSSPVRTELEKVLPVNTFGGYSDKKSAAPQEL